MRRALRRALTATCQKPANEARPFGLRLAALIGLGQRTRGTRWCPAACHRSHLRHILALALALFAERLRHPPTDKDPKIPAAKAGAT